MNIRNVVLFVVATAALPTLANSSGAPRNRTGESGQTCTACHTGNNGPAPTVTVENLPATANAGESILFTIRVHTNDSTGGTGACAANRCAGFAASTDTAGTFAVVAGEGTEIGGTTPNDNETTHSARKPFGANGDATFQVELTDLQPGEHTVFVAGNDVNGAGQTNDRVAATTATFTVQGGAGGEGEGEGEAPVGEGEGEAPVGEGEGEAPVGEGEGEPAEGEGEGEGEPAEGEGEPAEGEGEDGGGGGGCCSLTGTSPVSSVGLLVLLALLRRRRQR